MSDKEFLVSQIAKTTISAMVNGGNKENKDYDTILASCVPKERHMQQEGDPKRLYTITTIARSLAYGGTRTPVICDNFARACEIVETNEGDIWEYSYMLAVIEAVMPNCLYGVLDTKEQYWYRWVGGSDGGYEPIEIPDVYDGVLGWGIG